MELYQAKSSKEVIAATTAALLVEGLLVATMVAQTLQLIHLGAKLGIAIVVTVALIILLMNVSVLFWVPRGYRITRDKVIVMGLFRPIKEIDRRDIQKVAVIDDALQGAIRTFGSGGFYGYFGKFSSDRFGKFDMYARNSGSKAVLIESRSNQKLIVAPSDAEAFVRDLNHETPTRNN